MPSNIYDNNRLVSFVWGYCSISILCITVFITGLGCYQPLSCVIKTKHSPIRYDLQRPCYHFHIYHSIVSKVLCISVLRGGMPSTHTAITINV